MGCVAGNVSLRRRKVGGFKLVAPCRSCLLDFGMNRRDIISFLRRNTSSATLGYLRLNVDEKLSMVVLIGSDVVANLTVSSMVDYDGAFVVSLDIPKEYWALHYIDFDELFPRNWPSTEEQRAGEHKGGGGARESESECLLGCTVYSLFCVRDVACIEKKWFLS